LQSNRNNQKNSAQLCVSASSAFHFSLLIRFLVAALFIFQLTTPTWSQLPQTALPQVEPASVGFDADWLDRIDPFIVKAIEAGQLPGCVVCIGRKNSIAFLKAFGHRQIQPKLEPMTTDTVFDLASITKPVATAISIMLLVERGEVRLRDPIAKHLPEFAQNGKEHVTIEHLLTHQGGLIPDNEVADYEEGAEKAWERIWALGLTQPPGEKFVYTDVGFLTLAEIIRRKTGQDVAEFARENIFRPLGMNETAYLPSEDLRQRAAPTEQRDGKWLRGEVHDPRAALLGGVAGHAGLFSTARDLALFANAMLTDGKGPKKGSPRILSQATMAEMIRPRDIHGQRRGLGWDMRSKYSSNRGEIFSPQAFGHGGFTGTTLWIDPGLDLFVIFLSNRLHPDGMGSVNRLAGRIGTIAAAALRKENPLLCPCKSPGASFERPEANIRPVNPVSPPVPDASALRPTLSSALLTGIDVLQRNNFQQLADRRVGLITNHTGVDRHGTRTVDLIHNASNVHLIALFSPEHGLQGKLDQAKIGDARDEQTGLPIHSLYGPAKKPTAAQLAGIDTLVFDIQDIGTRFYTYLSTMGLAMETAAEQGLRFVVLDRPNPIGGIVVAGPMLDQGKESFVGYHRLPVRHGMTLGELATMFRAERGLDLDLQIVQIDGWQRTDYWDATGLTWVNPSPNMRSLTQAVLYPGMGLLETTNLSVGRGTDTPFEVIGAPWIDGRQLAGELATCHLPGVVFVPIEFTPNASKYAGEKCSGMNIIVTDRNKFQSVRTGLHIACALRRLYPNDWDMDRYNRLLANEEAFEGIQAGCNKSNVEALVKLGNEEFLARRAKYLLYREFPRQDEKSEPE